MPYIDRAPQFHHTLLSYRHWYKDRNDYEIIIVEDAKNVDESHNKLKSVISTFKELPIRLIKSKVVTYNPAPAFNLGIRCAKGKYIIITNPEVFHYTNILEGLDGRQKDDTYYVCACRLEKLPAKYPAVYTSDINRDKKFKTSWYQHTKFRNKQYHFCSCISKENYNKIGGFDERYIIGMGYDDTDFIETIRKSDLRIVAEDAFVTVHQYHEWILPTEQVQKLSNINKKIYEEKWGVKA